MKHEPMCGDHISGCLKRMVEMANQAGKEVTAKFNDRDLLVQPGASAEQLEADYNTESDRIAEEYAKSPAGQEAARRREEYTRIVAAAEAEGIKSFKIRNVAGWEAGLRKNQDPYGACIYRYAARWAALMEERMAAGGTLADVADQAGHDADLEGITGFMRGCAVFILASCWEHGEELRRWHNLKTQMGNEGERANAEGGILNPALLSFGD